MVSSVRVFPQRMSFIQVGDGKHLSRRNLYFFIVFFCRTPPIYNSRRNRCINSETDIPAIPPASTISAIPTWMCTKIYSQPYGHHTKRVGSGRSLLESPSPVYCTIRTSCNCIPRYISLHPPRRTAACASTCRFYKEEGFPKPTTYPMERCK